MKLGRLRVRIFVNSNKRDMVRKIKISRILPLTPATLSFGYHFKLIKGNKCECPTYFHNSHKKFSLKSWGYALNQNGAISSCATGEHISFLVYFRLGKNTYMPRESSKTLIMSLPEYHIAERVQWEDWENSVYRRAAGARCSWLTSWGYEWDLWVPIALKRLKN